MNDRTGKKPKCNRLLYAAGVVLCIFLIVGDMVDLLMLPEITKVKVLHTSLHVLVWTFLAIGWAGEYKKRKKTSIPS